MKAKKNSQIEPCRLCLRQTCCSSCVLARCLCGNVHLSNLQH